jgi:hypothetical protein
MIFRCGSVRTLHEPASRMSTAAMSVHMKQFFQGKVKYNYLCTCCLNRMGRYGFDAGKSMATYKYGS